MAPETGAVPPSVDGLSGEGTDLGRLLALSDGIFAFSMTLLVVIFVLPTVGAQGDYLPGYLGSILPALGGYALSFFIVATWWSQHHRVFASLRRYDDLLVRLNNVFLFLISITPFLLALVFEFGPREWLDTGLSAKLAVGLYSGAQLATGLVFLALWRHATGNVRLVDPAVQPSWIDYVDRQGRARVAVMAVAILCAAVLPLAGEIAWIGIIVARRQVRRPDRSAPAGPANPTPPIDPDRT